MNAICTRCGKQLFLPRGGCTCPTAKDGIIAELQSSLAAAEAENKELRRQLESSENIRIAEKKILIDEVAENKRLREALKLIAAEGYCMGPGCPYCEREDMKHPYTAVAKVAQQSLAEKP